MSPARGTAEAVELLRGQWPDGDTRELFLIQMLPTLLDKVTRVVSDNLRIDKLTILHGGDGQGLPTYVKNLTNSAVTSAQAVGTGQDGSPTWSLPPLQLWERRRWRCGRGSSFWYPASQPPCACLS